MISTNAGERFIAWLTQDDLSSPVVVENLVAARPHGWMLTQHSQAGPEGLEDFQTAILEG